MVLCLGMLEWKGGTLLLHITLWITYISSLLADDLVGGCNSQHCWELYQTASDYYQSDVSGVSDQQTRKCIILRTYKGCLVELDSTSTACSGALDFQGTMRVLQVELKTNNCTEEGLIYPEGPEPEKTETVTPCTFKGRPEYSYCTLFGDPHLITFDGEQATCRLKGAWPLIDNEFLTVQVTNSALQLPASSRAATVTERVTVVVKGRGGTSPSGAFCGSREAVFYMAETGSLPTTFSDGMREYGAYNSIQVNTIIPGEQVEIYMKYIDSTVIIRQINNEYLSVGVRIPEKVLNGTISKADSKAIPQLCINSCPSSERVNLAQLLSNISSGSPAQQVSYASAQQTCRAKSVTDFFFDSCVFDIIMTGKKSFSNMANSAYEDVRKYSSRQPRWSNRTELEQHTKPSVSGRPDGTGNTSATVTSSCLVRTLLFVYIMHIISL